jgi:anion-transporting  ArsA/GET3 family ATPase
MGSQDMAATALARARHGRRTIALSLDITHSLADSFETE